MISFTNVAGSPLGAAARCDIALGAGPELAVAATKSVLVSMVAGLGLVAGWRADAALAEALRTLPPRLSAAGRADWSALSRALADARACYVLARGPELGVAQEVALKIAETIGVPALAYSSAEFLHGPLAALGPHTPVLALALRPEGLASAREALARARAMDAPTLGAGQHDGLDGLAEILPLPPLADSLADALLPLLPAWLAIESAARAAGRDPDQPRGLAKVTETL